MFVQHFYDKKIIHIKNFKLKKSFLNFILIHDISSIILSFSKKDNQTFLNQTQLFFFLELVRIIDIHAASTYLIWNIKINQTMKKKK